MILEVSICNVLFDTLKVLLTLGFIYHPHPLTLFYLTLMLIGVVILTLVVLYWAIVFISMIISSSSLQSANQLCPDLVLMQNIEELLMLCQIHVGFIIFFQSFIVPFQKQLQYIVTTLVQFIFLIILFSIIALNTLKQIYILFVKKLLRDQFVFYTFDVVIKLLIISVKVFHC